MQTFTRPNDKAQFPAGPWMDEPDKVVWIDEATGLDCMANRSRMGNWCGYVGVGPGHPLHGVGYSEHIAECTGADPDACWECPTPEGEFQVHGGLTFASGCQQTDSPAEGVCHVPEPARPHDVWWFGFDCAHGGDLVPTMYRSLPASLREGEMYRDLAYVRAEASSLAKQVAEFASR